MSKKRSGRLRNLLGITTAIGLFAAGGIGLWLATLTLPDLTAFESRKVVQSTKIYDRTGEVLLFELADDIQRTVVLSDEISHHMKNATVAIEDAEFYDHIGIKPTAFLRAVIVNTLSLGFEQGGSTITQQVVKNTLLTSEKTIARKLKEWVLALKLERAFSKEDILALYLNESPYGGNVYGIEEAAQRFFGIPARDLSLLQSAYLAALPQAPTYYSPYGNHTDALKERMELVLSRMLALGFITQEEYDAAIDDDPQFKEQQDLGIQAPHFVMYIREYLEETYGRRAVEERGFRVTTTLNWDMQQKAEEIVNQYALANEENFNAENAGLIAIDPKTGHILSMVGSRNYFDEEIDGNFNVTLARRQPGSAFKPFAYAAALLRGYTPETVVFDVATQFSTACGPADDNSTDGCYAPTNYDDVFRGPVSFRDALAQSINIPAIKVLYLAGLEETFGLARRMGITSLTDTAQYGLTLVLGGGEVTLLDITSAYGVFANEGTRLPATGILRIEDANGNLIEEYAPHPQRVVDQNVALAISDMLSDNEARTPAFGSRSPLFFNGYTVAAKTGTTNDYRDAWIIGYTPDIAVGTWAGNNDNSSMEKRVAGFVVAPMWNEFMKEILPQTQNSVFPLPAPDPEYHSLKPILRGIWLGGDTFMVDTRTGERVDDETPEASREEWVTPDIHSILHWVDSDDPRGDAPSDPQRNPQYRYWEYGVAEWVREHGYENIDMPVPVE